MLRKWTLTLKPCTPVLRRVWDWKNRIAKFNGRKQLLHRKLCDFTDIHCGEEKINEALEIHIKKQETKEEDLSLIRRNQLSWNKKSHCHSMSTWWANDCHNTRTIVGYYQFSLTRSLNFSFDLWTPHPPPQQIINKAPDITTLHSSVYLLLVPKLKMPYIRLYFHIKLKLRITQCTNTHTHTHILTYRC